jgi:uncharacterized iron-regulated membrane protein
VIYLALAGPWLALGFLLVMQQLERWLDEPLWEDNPAPRNELPQAREVHARLRSSRPDARPVSRSP